MSEQFLAEQPLVFSAAELSEHENWMRQALQLAEQAEQCGEVPVGALLVRDGEVVGEGHNQSIAAHDATAHAEIVALRAAGQALGNYRLLETTLYVTLEPCVMCMGAILNARVKHIIFAATDPKRGAVCSALQLGEASFSNHRVAWTAGVLQQASSDMLKAFFRQRR
jgi:tRNA(adenine34) deaminase